MILAIGGSMRVASGKRERERERERQRDRDREPTNEELRWLASEAAQWVRARRWQRLVTGAVAQAGLHFNEWLVLSATDELTTAKHDAVSQNEVARALELTRMQVSRAMGTLSDYGLVDRGPDMSIYMLWRVIVTRAGRARLAAARKLVSDAARVRKR